MKIKCLDSVFCVCKISNISQVNFDDEFCFISKTNEEISLVCTLENVPENALECDTDWLGFRIEGMLNFSLIGILSKISSLLAENNISVFAVSTYNTDYFFTKSNVYDKAINILSLNGYEIM